MRLRKHLVGFAGVLLAFVPLLHIIREVLDFAGYADFIIYHRQNPGWVGNVFHFIIDPPNWAILCSVIIAALLIWADIKAANNRQRTHKNTVRDIKFARKKFLRFGITRRDKTINECIDYIVNFEWNDFNNRFGGATLSDVLDAILTIRQQAFDGSITIWGRKDNLWEPIQNEFWKENEIDLSVPSKSIVRSLPYLDLMGSRKQFESIDWESCRMKAPLLSLDRLFKPTNSPAAPLPIPAPSIPPEKTTPQTPPSPASP